MKVGQETTVPDVAVVTVTVVVPLPPALFESPEYVAVIVGVPPEVSLYVIPHVPEASVHGFDVVNEPVPDEVVNTDCAGRIRTGNRRGAGCRCPGRERWTRNAGRGGRLIYRHWCGSVSCRVVRISRIGRGYGRRSG